LLREWVPAAEGAAGGYILLRSDVPVIAIELFGTTSLTALANVPPQPIQTDLNPAASAPNLKVFPPMAVLETKTTQQFQARIRPLDSNAPILLLVVLTGADFKTVDTIGGNDNKPEGNDIATVFLRSGGVIAPLVRELQILSSESSYVVTIR
jgi:hypothetical protein